MRWVPLSQTHFPQFISFILRNEWKSVSLSSRLLQEDGAIKNLFQIKDTVYCLVGRQIQTVRGVFLLTREGLLLPLFDGTPAKIEADGIDKIRAVFRKKGRVFCILGYEPDVLETLQGSDLTIDTERRYNLLERSLPMHPVPPRRMKDVQVKRGRIEDADKLYHLERKYVIDEVLIHKETFHGKAVLRNLRKTCTSQILLYVEKNGIAAAKANTNAMGINYAQIGGVFTDYNFRRAGYSTLVMEHLLHELVKMRKKCILFVKKSNFPANNLYRKLGFKKRGDYRITYIKY